MPGTTERLLQPVVLVGEFAVAEDGRLETWRGTIEATQAWEQQRLPHFAGLGTYRRRVNWRGEGRVVLHLPNCHDAVEAFVSGQPCGIRVWPPYIFDITEALREGDNEVELRVSNTLGNIILETYAGAQGLRPATSGLAADAELLLE